ncbi:helix-turn-helix transcriptional regulator [Facklamia hominis]|uniref:Transcriptional regulator n=1 Tax=Facklamia hominis TaxID=178214 RepID=A0AAJ1Q4H4_9LACT|nr:transcriptional regulator [Facklamia hominis]MDK7187508.1 transcriptional regulator [Facklamia hominis]
MNEKLFKVAGYRTMLGLTQKDLSLKLGITTENYSLKERGKRRFNDNEKMILVDLFKIIDPSLTIDKLFFK